MTEEIQKLEENKVYLLKLNGKYVHVMNQYYRDMNKSKKHLDLHTRPKTKSKEIINSKR